MSSTAPDTAPSGHIPGTRRPPLPARAPSRALLHGLRRAAPALTAFLAVHVTGLLFLVFWTHRRGRGVWRMLAMEWDSRWYLGIAEHGYTHQLGVAFDHNNLAFFPLYPLLVRAVAVVTPGSPAGAGLAVAVVASLVAAWGVFAVGDRLGGRRVGVLLTVLWAALPVALVQWMGYTESLFTAFAAWTLYAVLDECWLWAAVGSSLAGLTRPTGIALAAAVSLAALLSLRRGFSGRALAAVLLAPAGWCAYLGWVGLRLRRWDGYFAVQRMWHNDLDGGHETLRRLRELFSHQSRPELFLVVVTLTMLVSVVLFALSVWDRQPLPLLVFTGVLLVIVLFSGGVYFPRARFLLPGFPLLLPLAVHLSRASRRYRTLVLAAAVAGSAYVGAYMLLVWPSAP